MSSNPTPHQVADQAHAHATTLLTPQHSILYLSELYRALTFVCEAIKDDTQLYVLADAYGHSTATFRTHFKQFLKSSPAMTNTRFSWVRTWYLVGFYIVIDGVLDPSEAIKSPDVTYEWLLYLDAQDLNKYRQTACIQIAEEQMKMANVILKAWTDSSIDSSTSSGQAKPRV